MKTAEQLRQEAQACVDEAHASWERSDTDGALSQWSNSLTARLKRLQADLLDDGGVAPFPALFKDGKRVRAKLVDGDWGRSWCVLNAADRAVLWLPHHPEPGPRTKLRKLGFEVGTEMAPAAAKLHGTGKGLGSLHTVRPIVFRTDDGYPADATPYEGA